jgi:hypothetical protein
VKVLHDRCRVVASIAAAILLSWVVSGTKAAADDTFKYGRAQVGWLSISPLAMGPWKSTAPSGFTKGPDEIVTTDAGCFGTGVYLPHGATITSAVVWYSTAAAGVFFETALHRHDLSNGEVNEFAHAIFSDYSGRRANGFMTFVDRPVATVDQRFDYSFSYCLVGGGGKFMGARIRYTYTNAGD